MNRALRDGELACEDTVVSTTAARWRLGGYEVYEEIGGGITGLVYRGRDPALDRTVALTLVSHSAGPETQRESYETRFFEEARRAARLSHSGIAAIYGAGKDPATGALFLVAQLFDGVTLAQLLQEGRTFSWREALRLVGSVAHALHHAHENGVVHRDVQPANLLLVPSGEPKLTNFTIAEIDRARTALSSTSEALVALYLSPEQAVGERVDWRTDIFSLGAVAYRLLTGRDAFGALDLRTILSRVIHDEPPRPTEVASDLPPGVDDLLRRAVAKTRKDRYRDARSFSEDVTDILEGRLPRHSSKANSLVEAPVRAVESSSPVGTLPVQIPAGDGANMDRRSVTRVVAGALAFGLIPVLELLRRAGEPTVTGTAPPEPAPEKTPPPAVTGPGPEPSILPDVGLPSIVESARLLIDLRHPLKSGNLRVFVDEGKVLERPLSASVTKSILGIKLRQGLFRHVLEVKPGRRRVEVRVQWDDNESTAAIVGAFKAGSTRRLSARMGRLAKAVRLDWE